jgi:hypothetical protein
MKVTEFKNKETGERITSIGGDDYENVNPAQKFYEACFIQRMMSIVPEETMGDKPPSDEGRKVLEETAKICKEFVNNFRAVPLPGNLIDLLSSKKKSEQQKLLKNLALTPEILASFLLLAGDNGFTLSQYTSELHTTAVDVKKFPLSFRITKDGEVQKFGKTDLTDGQLKQAIEQRSVKVAKLLERADEWHCFFATYNSFRGKENWQNGQPHFHYISNLFGIEKNELVAQIKSKEYKLGNLPHIALYDYGVQPEK